MYLLTPSRKKVGKAVARGSKKAIANECMKDPMTKQHLLTAIGNNLRAELSAMCSRANTNSILCNQSSDALDKYTWGKLHDELAERAPLLRTLLEMCTHTRKPRINRQAVIGMCAVIHLKFRFCQDVSGAENGFANFVCWSCSKAGGYYSRKIAQCSVLILLYNTIRRCFKGCNDLICACPT